MDKLFQCVNIPLFINLSISIKDNEVPGIPKTAIAWLNKKTEIRRAIDAVEAEIEAEQEKAMEEMMRKEEEKRQELIAEMGEEAYQRMIMKEQGYTFPDEEEGGKEEEEEGNERYADELVRDAEAAIADEEMLQKQTEGMSPPRDQEDLAQTDE